nr:exodeoxyribonuclease VII small subunit [Bacilli bacterium]
MNVKEENMTFEEALSRLDAIVKDLEAGELALDVAIDKYQIGMQLAKVCREKLHNAEQKVEMVIATETGFEVRPFEVKE